MPRLSELTADQVANLPPTEHPNFWPRDPFAACETCGGRRPSGAYYRTYSSSTSLRLHAYGVICDACLRHRLTCGGCGQEFVQFVDTLPNIALNRFAGDGLCTPCYRSECYCIHCNLRCGPNGVCTACASGNPLESCPRCLRGTINSRGICARCNRPKPEPIESKTIRIKRPAGLELEFISLPIRDVASVQQWGHLHGDGSVGRTGKYYFTKDGKEPNFKHRDFVPQELSLFPESEDRLAALLLASTSFLVDNYDAYTNETCGTHTHVYVGDLSNKERANIRSWWRVHEYMFTRVLPQWRENVSFAKRCVNADEDGWARDRYRALNIAAFTEHGTYEFRLHHGTLDGPRLVNWSNLLLHFVECYRTLDLTKDEAVAMARGGKRGLFARFCKDTTLPLHLRKWIFREAEKFWTRRCGLFRGGADSTPSPEPTPIAVDPAAQATPMSATEFLRRQQRAAYYATLYGNAETIIPRR